MKIANVGNRAVLVDSGRQLDIETASDGKFGPTVDAVFEQWPAVLAWAATVPASSFDGAVSFDPTKADAAVPRPRQVLAVGLNYRAHAIETGLDIPEVPLVFTKFPSSVAAPFGTLEIPTPEVDWEVELAVVIGKTAQYVSREQAWDYVAGFTVAQDYSARDVQTDGRPPQFSLGKSFPGFLPLGPVVVSLDEFADRNALAVSTKIDGETVQSSSTSDLIFSIDTLVSYLSNIVTLLPGDVILTGTPSGVGLGMKPQRFLKVGEVVETTIEGIGTLRQETVAPKKAFDARVLVA